MRPLYKTLLIIGIAMGVVATSLIFGVGQSMLMHSRQYNIDDQHIYAIYHPSSKNGIRGMSLYLAQEVKSWLPEDVTCSVISFEHHDADVRIGTDFYDAKVIGVDADFAAVFGMTMVDGQFFSKEDQKNKRQVCIVTSDLVELFGKEALQSVLINGQEYEVIGAVQGDVNLLGILYNNYSANSIFLPVDTWYADFFEGNWNHGFILQLAVNAPGYSKEKLGQIISTNLVNMTDAPALKVAVPNGEKHNEWAMTFLILSGIFLVSFLVFLLAGLNIIQIASADVYDQQRVFGLKVALGALPQHLGREITREILACALQGGYLGVVLAGIVNTLMNRYIGMYWAAFNIFTTLAGLILALLVGWITAVIPARQAAMVDPVKVLRQER